MPAFFHLPNEGYADLLLHYQRCGIAATIIEKDNPEALEGQRALKISGRNIDLVIPVLARGVVSGGGGFGPSISKQTTVTHPVVDFHHIVRGVVPRNDADVNAKIVAEKKGLISKELVSIRWEGGPLAGRLNADTDLRQKLLRNGVDDLSIESDRANGCVRLVLRAKLDEKTTSGGVFLKETHHYLSNFPSLEVFGMIDDLAGRIKRGEVEQSPPTPVMAALPA